MTERSRYRYVCAGQVCYPVSTTREEAEKIAVEYTHAGWDVYLPAPVPVTYWITDTQTGEEIEYREICGPKQEDEPECADANGHNWVTINDEEEDEKDEETEEEDGTNRIRPFSDIDRCAKCGRYRVYYSAEPERGLPRFFRYTKPKGK